jgi:hypothetical protein
MLAGSMNSFSSTAITSGESLELRPDPFLDRVVVVRDRHGLIVTSTRALSNSARVCTRHDQVDGVQRRLRVVLVQREAEGDGRPLDPRDDVDRRAELEPLHVVADGDVSCRPTGAVAAANRGARIAGRRELLALGDRDADPTRTSAAAAGT